MISSHLTHFLKKHHAYGEETFARLIDELCEAYQQGSSCLPLLQSEVDLEEALSALACDQADSTVGSCSASGQPLILTDDHNLYFHRYYAYEQEIAERIQEKIATEAMSWDKSLEERLTALFGAVEGNDQAEAARKAISQNFSIISGGPGTGKTTTVLKILRLLKEKGVYDVAHEVLLLAPTGKAADRLRQSILAGLHREGLSPESFPSDTSTIHRALGFVPNVTYFRHDEKKPLEAKVIVIDESSMVDLPLMAKLFRAVSPSTKLILLGDRHQLTSVEVGSVLADLIQSQIDVPESAEASVKPLGGVITVLNKSYRNQGVIHQVCEAIKVGDAEAACRCLATSQDTSEQEGWVLRKPLPHVLNNHLRPYVENYWLPVLQDPQLSPEIKLEKIDEFRILSPLHLGPHGVQRLNIAVTSILQEHGMDTQKTWYEGRSVIIQENDHTLGIYNGDTGLCVRDEHGELQVAFLSEEGIRLFAPMMLPSVSDAWALTIHRTQGSEYHHVLMLLPEMQGERSLMSRELLYTGISRAKSSVTLWGEESTFKQAVDNQAKRASGLSGFFRAYAKTQHL